MSFTRRLTAASALLAITVAAACGDDNSTTEPPVNNPGAADITTDITTNRTLHADTTYTLKGFIHVTNGATLTIEPGTKILGDYATVGSSLFIMRGAKIMANGTADKPIVFTSSQPVGSRSPGDWGGLILLGNAIDSRTGTDVQLEGSGTAQDATPVSGHNYPIVYNGGTTQSDNSGVMTYVRVEFAGYAPATNAELNAFTFAAVGTGTHVSYLQALGGLDDSYEFFGGGLHGDHLVAYETGDDMFDMSEGFQGQLQYLIGYNSQQLTPRTGAGSLATDLEGIENDGCDGAGCTSGKNTTPFTIPVVANFTLVGCGSQTCTGPSGGYGMMIRRGTGGYYVNGVLTRFPAGAISLRDDETFARAGNAAVPDLATADLAVKNVYIAEIGAGMPLFQTGTGQHSFDLAGNNLVSGTVTGTGLFTAIPATGTSPNSATDLDWTPVANSPIATGGLATFSGKLSTAAGTFATGTSYVGAAQPGGAKWWAGWTNYARK
jgi:hypothetical protein